MIVLSGLNTWNINDNHVDIESELAVIADCAPPGEEARGGERYAPAFVIRATPLSILDIARLEITFSLNKYS